MTYHSWQFHELAMTLFLLSICCIGREFINAIDSIRFQVLEWLCFRWRFMEQPWHTVFHNSVRQLWLYFCYRFDASVVNSFMLSIPYGSCHSVFIDDFNFYSDSVFADDLWISSDIASLTIPSVSHDSISAIDLMRRSWIHWCCRFQTLVVN